MSVCPVTWSDFYAHARRVRYHHPQVLQQQVEALKPACKDLTPYVFDNRGQGSLLICKGKMLEEGPNGPAVFFVVTLKPQFPNAYPIMSIEQPPQGWRIKNHRHVDQEGLCYLNAVTSWNPRTTTLFDACAELQTVLLQQFPFERGPSAAQPAAPAPALPQQPQAQPAAAQRRLSQQQQQQSHQQPQRQQQQPSRPQQQQQPARDPVVATGATVALAVAGAIATSLAGPSRTTNNGTRLTAAEEDRAKQQRERDRAWLEQQNHRAHRQQEHEERAQAQEFARERFMAMVQGTTPLPPRTEVQLPPDFGFTGKLMTGDRPEAALKLATRKAPHPGPAITDPTPDQQYAMTQQRREQERVQQERQEASKPQPKGAFGIGLRALSRGVMAVGSMATSAKSSVEDKVRESSTQKEQQRFAQLFPQQAAAEHLVSDYHCQMLCGDGIARKGYLFLTPDNFYFSTKPLPDETAGNVGTGLALQVQIPVAAIVSLAAGNAVSYKCLSLLLNDDGCRTFMGFHSGKMVELGAYVSDTVKGSALERCHNYMDHLWRAKAAVPVPGYPYDQPLSAAPAGTGVIPVPVPANAQQPPAPQQPAAAPAPRSETPPAVDNTCAICMENVKNAFLRPCGHVATCMPCASQLRNCPICRAPIQETFQAFL